MGDELFACTTGAVGSVGVIAYSGPMATQGQWKARCEEYQILLNQGQALEEGSEEAYAAAHVGCPDVDPIASTGMMLVESWKAYQAGALEIGGLYEIYGPSVHPALAKPVGQFQKRESSPYLWPPLEAGGS